MHFWLALEDCPFLFRLQSYITESDNFEMTYDIMRFQMSINEYLVSCLCGQSRYLVRIADSVPGR